MFFLRLASKLPPGVSQPPQFAKKPWQTQPKTDPWSQGQNQPTGRPLDHIPHIRNPKLRQYYLQGAPAVFRHPTHESFRSIRGLVGSSKDIVCCMLILFGTEEEQFLPVVLKEKHLVCFLCFSGTSWDVNNTAVKHQDIEGASCDSTGIMVSHLFFVFLFLISNIKQMWGFSFMSGEACKSRRFYSSGVTVYGLVSA